MLCNMEYYFLFLVSKRKYWWEYISSWSSKNKFLVLCTCQSEYWGGWGRHMTEVSLTILGTLDNSNIFNIILTLQIVEILISWERILTLKANSRVGILTDKPFLCQIYIDMCIIINDSCILEECIIFGLLYKLFIYIVFI